MNGAFKALRLKTNPFAPERIEGGQLLRFDYAVGPLSPETNPRHLDYYFDLYDWSDTQQLGNIGPDGRLVSFPAKVGRPGIIIVISGFSGSGRTSLINLLLYEIKKHAPIPIIVNYPVRITNNHRQDAINFAERAGFKNLDRTISGVSA